MSQWIKKSPIPAIQLAILVLASYFLIYRLSVLTGLIFFFLWFRLFHQYGKKVALKILPILLMFLVLFVGHVIKTRLDEKSIPSNISKLELIPDSLRIKGDRLSFQATSDGRKYQAFYQLKSQEEQNYFQKMDDLVVLTVKAEVSQAETARNFNGFDYRAYLQTREIYALVEISDILSIQVRQSRYPMDWILLARRKSLLYIANTFPAPMRHYMSGLLFGELDTDFEEMEDIYSSLGIIHLFALSGMQVGFFIDKLRYLLLRFGLKRETVDKIQILFSIFYAGMTGLSISVIRSLVQKILGNMGLRGLDNMAMTLAVCYVLMPHFLLSAGGMLSFAYAFLLSVFDFEKLTMSKRILVESLAISFGIFPVLIFYFYSFQPLSILLTLAFSIIFDVVLLPLLSVLFLLSPIVAVTQVNVLFVWLEKVIVWISDRSNFSLVFGKPEAVVLLGLMVIFALIYDFFHRKKIVIGLSCLSILLLFLTKQPLTNEVTVVDVGQGDSILLRDAQGKTILIDVGGRPEFGAKEQWQKRRYEANAKRTLIPYLKSRGIGKIDQLVLTHTDTDHVGDMEVVAREIHIGEILVSPGSLTDRTFVQRLRDLRVPVRAIQAGEQLTIMGSRLHVLYPFGPGDGGNNDSIILYGQLLNKNFLFTGDLEEAGEEALIVTYPKLPVDVLKAGHHGSKGSSTEVFLDHIQPKLALLSAGRGNRYKHPHQETLDRLSERKIASLRTDQQGAIRFIGWKNWRVETVK
ncbi:DNA internalization-related competence protein ComEC/Rec2 [Streptococcus minor]|uniref:DNA internalization-related competence protein ComEC/Rec2 n=1 Tax=Streptococcus minor TaxID=229549 RepID=UPI0003638FC1|nr:DNA internalization-related competence protein ComEC/Rec2 [Streptococcus minor]